MRPPQHYIDDGLISCRAHPDDPELVIFNYTKRCQFNRAWDEHTMRCRGLIMRGDTVIARPFPKFFNLEELDEPPKGKPIAVYEKLDGSLGILYPHPGGQWAIASRGSFDSPQAIEGTRIIRIMLAMDPPPVFNCGVTYMFEIVYPENRIVVDYGSDRLLYLIAARRTADGVELPLVNAGPLKTPRMFKCDDWQGIREELPCSGDEGFVVLFYSGQRVKLKYAEYVRLHRAISGLTPRRVWEILADPGLSFLEFAAGLPDEVHGDAWRMHDNLMGEYARVEAIVMAEHRGGFQSRKDAAAYFKTCTYPAVLFKMLDNRPYDALIWKAIRPKAEPIQEDTP